MVTTAARSRDYMRKLGFIAEVVEHRVGSFIRKDLFDFADVLCYKPDEGIILIQAYQKSATKEHDHLNLSNEKIRWWTLSGGKFEHQIWSFKTIHGRKYWSVTRKEI